ncbi:MAG TPA: methyltransferase domain-containing protein [Chitinophagaceae bacterium]
MSEQAWYKDWFNSPFYHKLYFERDEKEAEAFILRLIDHLKPATGSYMLDVACGRGRHSRILAKKGFRVTGIDISFDSIAYAKKFVREDSFGDHENLEFYRHDMRLPFRVNYFDYAFNFFTSFGYFKTRREHDDAIRTIANGLKPGGIFVIDYLNVHYSEDHLVYNEEKNLNGTTYEIHRWHDETHFFKKITINDPLLHHPIDYTEKVSKFSFGDLNDMLSYHGLQVQEVFGDYQMGNYDVRTKPRLIIVARKNSK